jgi:dihydroorotase|tara:strand:+ start:1693 stop:3048 length:1356 start_codon:yes stop_codon:yes gene_type:complete
MNKLSGYLIKNASLVNDGQIKECDLLIKNGHIERIDSSINQDKIQANIIEAKGSYVLPGVIDSQVHFREPGLIHKGEIKTESMAAIAGGVTSYIDQPNTIPSAITILELEKKYLRASKVSWANYSFNLGATNDNLEELKRASKENIAGIKIFMGSSTGNMLVDNQKSIERIFSEVDHQLIAHCEDEQTIKKNLEDLIKKKGERGLLASDHPIIRSSEGCYLSSSKAINLAKKTGARFHVYHVSTAIELDLFDGSIPLKEKKITSEACVHHLWFCDEDYKSLGNKIKWNPAVKTGLDRAALRRGLLDGRIDVVSTDHAPHTLEEKLRPYSKAPAGGPSIQYSLLAMIEMTKQSNMDITKVVQLMCHNQADLFRINKRGYLREGYHADIVIVDPMKNTVVEEKKILSKCSWSPFENQTFGSNITHTFVNGVLNYQNGKILGDTNGHRLQFLRK